MSKDADNRSCDNCACRRVCAVCAEVFNVLIANPELFGSVFDFHTAMASVLGHYCKAWTVLEGEAGVFPGSVLRDKAVPND
jgi:hypothetical protein